MNNTVEFRKITVFSLAVFFALLFPGISAHAEYAKMDIIPSLSIQEELNSNVYNTPNNEVSSLGTRISPNLELKMMSQDNVTITLGGGYDKIWQYSRDAKDASDSTWNASVGSTGAWTITPNFNITPSFYFMDTKNSTNRAGFIPMGDPLMPSISGISYVNSERQSTGAALDFMYRISPRWNTNLIVDYLQEHFRRSGITINDPVNSSQTGVRVGVNYVLSPLSQAGLFAQVRFIEFEDSANTKSYSAGLTSSHRLSETLKLSVDAGVTHTVRDNDTGSDSGDTKTGPMANILLKYTGQAFQAELFGNTLYAGVSGYGDITQQYTGGIRLEQQFTQTISGKLSGFFQNSRSVFQNDAVNINALYGTASVIYQPLRIMSIYLQGTLNNQRSKNAFGDSIDSYLVMLGVKIAVPYHIL